MTTSERAELEKLVETLESGPFRGCYAFPAKQLRDFIARVEEITNQQNIEKSVERITVRIWNKMPYLEGLSDILREELSMFKPASTVEVDGWKPIETAPKNTSIRIFNEEWIDEDLNPTGSYEAFWQDDVGWIAAVWNNTQDCYETQTVTPTHWRPLPPAPTDNKPPAV